MVEQDRHYPSTDFSKKLSLTEFIVEDADPGGFGELGCPPDLQEAPVKTVLMQAELLCADWV